MDKIGEVDFDRVNEVREQLAEEIKNWELNYREAVVLLHQLHSDVDDLAVQNLGEVQPKE